MKSFGLQRYLAGWLVAVILGVPGVSWADGDWVLVDTKALTLTVLSAENHPLVRFRNIAIGSGGTSDLHRHGDESTPRGIFHVAWVDHHSRFNMFYGLDYPSAGIARHAYDSGDISQTEFDAIMQALRHHRTPPQNTALGGQLGIHGLGGGNPDVQQTVNWTDGCVALTNRDIRRLGQWMHVGTRVVIR